MVKMLYLTSIGTVIECCKLYGQHAIKHWDYHRSVGLSQLQSLVPCDTSRDASRQTVESKNAREN